MRKAGKEGEGEPKYSQTAFQLSLPGRGLDSFRSGRRITMLKLSALAFERELMISNIMWCRSWSSWVDEALHLSCAHIYL